ncbi:MAG TPA: DUF1549 and DUF1553 domain-containing protein [Isosphaeraceae bacterium]|nr:DUF1549 and DUF1553 domain-containing protein [Isosphaeraceae bacterium]
MLIVRRCKTTHGPGRDPLRLVACVGLAWWLLTLPGLRLQAAGPPRTSRNPVDLAGYDALITAEERAHWAFQPLKVPKVPVVKNTAWVRNPIDRFVLAKLEEKGWPPAPPAGPHALLRRLFLDLTGLPPTPDDQRERLADLRSSPDAVERLVDDLLARPAYGERWGRHWLDLVRYAESNGYERDATKPFAWRYRDYVIRAFNADKPFDRFVIEQLAGDELPEGEVNAETLVATGYYRLGPWDDEPADPRQDRFDQLDDLVNTTSEVFLGLTLGCARCHNHKFEPMTMHDYYRMVAIFDPLQRPVRGRTELALPIGTPAQVSAADTERKRQIVVLRQRLRDLEQNGKAAGADANGRRAALKKAIEDLQAKPLDLPHGYFLREASSKPPVTHLLLRGQASNPGPEVGPGVPAVVVQSQPAFPVPPPDARTSRRRLTLARWLTGPDNPLTPRVIVNRVWQSHFGVGLVRTPSDFGTMGDPPTHPELLDWLAGWFVEHGWSLKALHRLILTSGTYRITTQTNSRGATEDPENRLLWRMPYRRLEVEAIRDAMLAASGELNRQMYGPSIYPAIPQAALAGHSDPDRIWRPSQEGTAARRTIYVFLKRSLIVPMLEVLDLCDTARSTPRRNITSAPTQALTLLNGEFVNQQARHLADRLEKEAGPDPAAQIERAYLLTLCRPPARTERTALLEFLERECRERLAEAAGRGSVPDTAAARHQALEQVCRAILNLNEFVYPD